jgi:hypothetical protein
VTLCGKDDNLRQSLDTLDRPASAGPENDEIVTIYVTSPPLGL